MTFLLGPGKNERLVFCRIVAGQIPATVLSDDEQTLAFMDIGSVNPGHVLVAAKPHVENIYGVDAWLAAALFQATARIVRAVNQSFAPGGVSIHQANGQAAGQTVMHFHIHACPRREGDGMD
jgi:histidine triad (HIT) family protein